MANWEKLNKEFDDCLDSMTKEDWDNWYKNVEQKRINQNKMKITIEYEDKAEALNAMQGEDWHDAMYDLDQKLRGIVKHGYSRNKELNETELEVYSQCRELLQQVMNDNELNFNV